jgi:GntR family transcriptional regulator
MIEGLSSIRLEKNVPIPLYYQLKKQLLTLIDGAVLQEGDMLPPENEFCNLLHVSRPTVRQAFSELVAEGFLNRYKGKGTFVSKHKLEERFLSKLETFDNEMISKGLIPQTKIIALKKITDPHEANGKLGIPLGAPLIYLSRVRLADKVPLVYVETFLPYEQYSKLMDVDFKVNSLYQSLEKIYSIRVNRVRREIEAINAHQKEAELLQITKNKALILVKTVASSDDASLPVEYSIARYRGDRNKFSVEILGYYCS